jgi:hypothetical protein
LARSRADRGSEAGATPALTILKHDPGRKTQMLRNTMKQLLNPRIKLREL